jgi:hypothetical protein
LTGAAYVLVLAVAIVTVASILATTFAYVANRADPDISGCLMGGFNSGFAFSSMMIYFSQVKNIISHSEILSRAVTVVVAEFLNQVVGPADSKAYQCL